MKSLRNKSVEPKKGKIRISGDRRAGRDGSKVDGSEIDGSEVDGSEVEDNKVSKKVQKMSKFKKLSKSKKIVGSDFLTPGARLAFTKLR